MEGACLPAYGPGGGAPRAWRPSTHACVCMLVHAGGRGGGRGGALQGRSRTRHALEPPVRCGVRACACNVCMRSPSACMPWRTRSYEVLSFDQTGVTLCAFSALKDASIERGWL